MSITDDLNTMKEERNQRLDAFEFRAGIQNFYQDLVSSITRLQAIIDRGHFDTIPVGIKVELNQAWNLVKACKSDFESDVGIMEILDWTP